MVDRKNSFRNTSYEHKRSNVIKSVESWVRDALKREKKNEKVFQCIDVGHIISRISGISRRLVFNIKRAAPALN